MFSKKLLNSEKCKMLIKFVLFQTDFERFFDYVTFHRSRRIGGIMINGEVDVSFRKM